MMSMLPNSLYMVVPAAGVGSRMQADRPKQYLPLLGKTVIEHTLQRLLRIPQLKKIIVVVDEADSYWPQLAISKQPMIETVIGGAQRCHSVLKGLRAMQQYAEDDAWVLVHDAARPCVNLSNIETLIAELSRYPDGGLLGIPLNDTLKQTGPDQLVTKTVDRRQFWAAQTPQMFNLAALLDAMEKALEKKVTVTDEASAMEAAGYTPKMVLGSRNNLKITQTEDLALAEFILSQQLEEHP